MLSGKWPRMSTATICMGNPDGHGFIEKVTCEKHKPGMCESTEPHLAASQASKT